MGILVTFGALHLRDVPGALHLVCQLGKALVKKFAALQLFDGLVYIVFYFMVLDFILFNGHESRSRISVAGLPYAPHIDNGLLAFFRRKTIRYLFWCQEGVVRSYNARNVGVAYESQVRCTIEVPGELVEVVQLDVAFLKIFIEGV
jgi:hypothetical protein